MVWPTKDANTFISKNLTLVKIQREEMESDCREDDFLKVHEKHPSYKAAFNFRTKMHTQLKTQRAWIVPLSLAVERAKEGENFDQSLHATHQN